MNFSGITNVSSTGYGFLANANPVDSTISIAYASDSPYHTFPNGDLLNLSIKVLIF